MNFRRPTLALTLLVLMAALPGAPLADAQPQPDPQPRPNIVLIYVDDLGYGDTSAYGAKAIQTPQIDRLAKEGVRFRSGYASSGSTPPIRFASATTHRLATGRPARGTLSC